MSALSGGSTGESSGPVVSPGAPCGSSSASARQPSTCLPPGPSAAPARSFVSGTHGAPTHGRGDKGVVTAEGAWCAMWRVQRPTHLGRRWEPGFAADVIGRSGIEVLPVTDGHGAWPAIVAGHLWARRCRSSKVQLYG